MASPKMEVFFLYDPSTGAPLAGVVGITFDTYKDSDGTNIAQPAITEIGGGAYGFVPIFTDPDKGIVYIVNAGASAIPQRQGRYMRPEDWNADNADSPSSAIQTDVTQVRRITEGEQVIEKSGPEANRMISYAPDGSTVLQKWDLFDENGSPTSTNPYRRVPLIEIP